MIKSNLSDTDIAILLFNKMQDRGIIQELISQFPSLDKRYTKGITVDYLSYQSFVLKNSFHVEVELWRPWNPWSAAYATTYTGNYNLIKLNSRRLKRAAGWLNLASIAGSIAHEWGHCLEYYYRKEIDPNVFFNHGDNSSVGKDNTFQYLLGRAVKKYLENYGNLKRLLRDLGIE